MSRRKSLDSILEERREFQPDPAFTAASRIKPDDRERLLAEAGADHEAFWGRLARETLSWHKPFSVTLDESQAPNYRWFSDGEINAAWNCLDVHLAERGDKTAIIFESEPGDSRRISYRELAVEVSRLANALKANGITVGDRVVIYMPMVPEAVIAMLACARIGAIHSVVFGGFSIRSLHSRIVDADARLVITADGGRRSGKTVQLKNYVDQALEAGCPSVEKVIVLRHVDCEVQMQAGRDIWWSDATAGQPDECPPVFVSAEHPLFLLYTSGSTGTPKGVQHATGGFLLGAKLTAQWIFDLRDDDVFWCTADIGWVTGHTYVTYGPLAAGATIMIYEGGPMYPDAGRFWSICERHGVTIFYTAPTAIRALMKHGEEIPAKYDLSKIRLLGSVGEPINPEAWIWYRHNIGRDRCPVVDTWWQTETGATLIAPLPGAVPVKPGSCTLALPGIDATIVDDDGNELDEPNRGGHLVIRKPWPYMLRTIWGDNERYLDTYWRPFGNRFYIAGDTAHRDKDGYFWVMGRADDVLNVSGHRLGTAEVESAFVAHPQVAEAAVVGRPHDIKGESIFAYVVMKGERPEGAAAESMSAELRAWVGKEIGGIARPDDIRFADSLPKTRSGKIMRRLLRAIARGEEITQDISTLENPAVVEQLRGEG